MDSDSDVSESSDTGQTRGKLKMDEHDFARRRSIEIAKKFAAELEHEGEATSDEKVS